MATTGERGRHQIMNERRIYFRDVECSLVPPRLAILGRNPRIYFLMERTQDERVRDALGLGWVGDQRRWDEYNSSHTKNRDSWINKRDQQAFRCFN